MRGDILPGMFTEFDFPASLTSKRGLQPASLRNLGQLVVLVGPNGAGKSRYLQIAELIISGIGTTQEDFETAQVLHALTMTADERARHLKRIAPGLRGAERGVKAKVVTLTYASSQDYGEDPLTVPPNDADSRVALNTSGGFESASESIYDYFFEVARALHDAKHPDTRDLPAIQQGLEDARAFNQILKALLLAEIEPGLNANRRVIARFRGRVFNPRELSMGELILAGWAIVLHRQKAWLSGSCVLIDEPENHLHPDVCIRALDALRKQILGSDGQNWLATHSVPLIAYAGIESAHFVDGGAIEYAGNKIEKVLDRLLGGPEGRSRLRALMADADEIAFDVFAAQSLLPPGVVSAQDSDPQQAQMLNATRNLGMGKENVRILDFAAGRGRLAAALLGARAAANRRFTYYAFHDPNFSDPGDRQECMEHIQSLEQEGAPETYLLDTLEGLMVRDAPRMDLVVMCNVLHEKDQSPPTGELPHANGYVILDELGLQHLFDSKEAVLRMPAKKDGRLTAFSIPRAFLPRVQPQTIGRALASVKRKAEEQIRQIRAKGKAKRTFQLGRLHAHITVLYANAQLASREFPDPNKGTEAVRTR